jgi:hypothetical protein
VPGAIAAEAGVSVPTVQLLFGTNVSTQKPSARASPTPNSAQEELHQEAARTTGGLLRSSIIQHHASHCS